MSKLTAYQQWLGDHGVGIYGGDRDIALWNAALAAAERVCREKYAWHATNHMICEDCAAAIARLREG